MAQLSIVRPSMLVSAVFVLECVASSIAIAQTSTTAPGRYDGQYAGQMALTVDNNSGFCNRGPFNKKLLIQNGRFAFAFNSTYGDMVNGSVGPDGAISALGTSSGGGTKLDAHITGNSLTGTIGSAYCTYSLQMQKS